MMQQFLFISNWINPFEPHFGGAQRSNLFLRALLNVGHVDFAIFQEGVKSNMKNCDVVYSQEIEHEKISRLQKWSGLLTPWKPYSIYRVNHKKEDIINQLVAKKKYDYIVVRYVPEALSCGLLKYADRLIIDVDDNPKDTLRNTANHSKSRPNKLYHYIASLWAPVFVKQTIRNIHAALFSNPLQVKGKNEYFLPNIAFEEPDSGYVRFSETKPRLFFVGRLDYHPNYMGVDWFINRVWPIIKQRIPSAEFHIAGKFTMDDIVAPYFKKWNAVDGISVLGFIDDVSKEYAACRATVSPIFVGAGTNIKLIESMQRKRVCITTECGMRGMQQFINDQKNVLVAKDSNEYAHLCIRALTDENYNHQIAQNAYGVVEKYFSNAVFNDIVKHIVCKK